MLYRQPLSHLYPSEDTKRPLWFYVIGTPEVNQNQLEHTLRGDDQYPLVRIPDNMQVPMACVIGGTSFGVFAGLCTRGAIKATTMSGHVFLAIAAIVLAFTSLVAGYFLARCVYGVYRELRVKHASPSDIQLVDTERDLRWQALGEAFHKDVITHYRVWPRVLGALRNQSDLTTVIKPLTDQYLTDAKIQKAVAILHNVTVSDQDRKRLWDAIVARALTLVDKISPIVTEYYKEADEQLDRENEVEEERQRAEMARYQQKAQETAREVEDVLYELNTGNIAQDTSTNQ